VIAGRHAQRLIVIGRRSSRAQLQLRLAGAMVVVGSAVVWQYC